MAGGNPFAAAAAVDVPAGSPSSNPTPARLMEALAALSQAFESGDTASSDAAVASVSALLNAADADVGGDADDDTARSDAAARVSEQLLLELHAFLSCPSTNQMAIDALSLELPKPVARLGALMGNCWDIAKTIIEFFVSNCNPRDMLSIFCDALDTPVSSNGSPHFVLLLDGLARVLMLIQRRHIEQVKVVLPAVLRLLHATVSECDEQHGKTAVDLFNAALTIGNAIQEVCKTLVNHKKQELCSLLGLYALQNIALVSQSKQQHNLSACGSLVLQHFKFLTFCRFTYLGLLTGDDVTSATNMLSNEEDADLLDCFSFAMHGACLTVVWTYMHDDMSAYAGAELESALKEVQGNYMRNWQAINMFRYVLPSVDYQWVIKSRCIDLLLTLVHENCIEETNDHVDFPSTAPQIFATLKAIESFMIAAPDALMRKKAFAALKKVISMVPSSQRFVILQALINNSMFPSLTAILLDLVKNEVLRESRRADQDCMESVQSQDGGELPPWASHALELVELILRPQGGPRLPDHSEQVLSALNLLRLILIIDSRGLRSGKMFREETRRKVYSEWLIPLRPIVAGIQLESGKVDSEVANQIMCSLNPVQLVLHRCIELVEEKMKGS